jgi:hypothetical protein
MKKFTTLLAALTIIFSVSYLSAAETTLDIKTGIGIPKAASKVGSDTEILLNIGLDKYFTLGLMGGFNWVDMSKSTASGGGSGIAISTVEANNAYTVPVMAVFQIRFASVQEEYGFMPYVLGGAGYAWMFHSYTLGTTAKSDIYKGFAWEALGGVAFKLADDSALSLFVEAGYRGDSLTNKGTSGTADMSGFIAHAGVRISLGGNE